MGGWMGRWMGGWVGGDILSPSVFLIFKYVNKKHVLIPKVDLKVAYAFSIKSYEHFKFQKAKIEGRLLAAKRFKNIFHQKGVSAPLKVSKVFKKYPIEKM